MSNYTDLWFQTTDGLRLYARDYANPAAPLTLLCMHGLTRNSADFEPLCELLQPDYHLLVPEQRGRGRSDYDSNPQNYTPATYVQDMLGLIDSLSLKNIVLLGTSMGGLMAMLMNALRPNFFTAVILNDIGPVIDPRGLERLRGYVGKTEPVSNWEAAITTTKRLNEIAFPHYQQQDWLQFAKRLYRENEAGIVQLQYDPAIAKPADDANDANAFVPPDLWPVFEQLNNIACLALRGELSDILSAECFAAMQQRNPGLIARTIAGVGHAPVLNEPEAVDAIKNFLAAAG